MNTLFLLFHVAAMASADGRAVDGGGGGDGDVRYVCVRLCGCMRGVAV